MTSTGQQPTAQADNGGTGKPKPRVYFFRASRILTHKGQSTVYEHEIWGEGENEDNARADASKEFPKYDIHEVTEVWDNR